MKKLLFSLLLIWGTAFALDMVFGGRIPTVSNIDGTSTLTMDFSNAGKDVVCANLFISNNTSEWDVTITTGNGGRFINSEGLVVVPIELNVVVGTQGGFLGRGAQAFVAAGSLLNGQTVTWHNSQTTATLGYNLQVIASWDKPEVAGIYIETIRATITATE